MLLATVVALSPRPTSEENANLSASTVEDGVLTVEGTTGDDLIVLRPSTQGRVLITVNGFQRHFSGVDRVVVNSGLGNDVVRAMSNFSKPVEMHGGLGDDVLEGGPRADLVFGEGGDDMLRGGSGNDVLVGGLGNDRLLGQAGRDLMIGSDGIDRLEGGDGDDILIAGPTIFDDDTESLKLLLARWSLNATYSVRVALITTPPAGEPRLDASTVAKDAQLDRLVGGGGQEVFLAAKTDSTDRRSGEIFVETNVLGPLSVFGKASV
jgi:Ca2+-binding RTX toxin-like protein